METFINYIFSLFVFTYYIHTVVMFIGFRFGNISFSKTDMVEPSENTAERILNDAGLYEYTVKDGKVKIENNLESMYMETRISHNKVKRVVGFSILSDIPCYGFLFQIPNTFYVYIGYKYLLLKMLLP